MTDYVAGYNFVDRSSCASPMEVARKRLLLVVIAFFIAFLVLIVRTLELGVSAPAPRETKTLAAELVVPPIEVARMDVVDRNGDILATNLKASSLSANPSMVKNPEVLAHKLVHILPGVSYAEIESKLKAGNKFVWIKRKLTPKQKWQVNALGEPALQFQPEEERLYPQGRLAAHVLGYVDVDGNGIGGLEHFFDSSIKAGGASQALKLSLDMRVQFALTDELESAMRAYQAKGAGGLVMDVNTGEVIALVSLPDFDPNNLRGVSGNALFNRVTQGVYELGSTFKTFTFAAALDDGVVDLDDGYDASKPLRIANFTIKDDHPRNRYLTLPEIFTYSSNIGTAQMALDLGADRQQAFLSSIGLLQPPTLELTEVGAPLYPATWRKSSTMTISYGHGIAVSPLQLVRGVAAMVNGGNLLPATLIADGDNWQNGKQVISPSTSRKIRQLLRLSVMKGTGRRAEAIGYRVGGKTGTAEKAVAGGYDRKSLLSSFIGVYPMDDPRYAVFAFLDEPQGTKETFGFASGGWVAAPVVKNVILRTAPLLGVAPKIEDKSPYQKVALMIKDK